MNALEAEPLANVAELDAGPGQKLRQGRESVNLSIDEVAARLHLDTRTVRCLESDQYDDLPAPTFVRGYLRSYARLLNLAPQPIVDGFDRRGLEPPALIADISTSEEATSTDAPMRIATAAIIFALLAGVVLWWNAEMGADWLSGNTNDGSSATPAQLEPSLPRIEAGAAREPQTEDQSVAEAAAALPTPAVPTQTAGGVALPGAQALSASGQATSGQAQAAQLQAAQARLAQAGATSAVSAPTTAAAAAALAVGAAAAPGTATAGGVGHLLIRVRRDSWVEVYDRGGERLYYSTGKAGDTIDVRGAAPLNVLVGFAEGVRVEYNAQPVDLSSHTVRGLARFKLGATP